MRTIMDYRLWTDKEWKVMTSKAVANMIMISTMHLRCTVYTIALLTKLDLISCFVITQSK